MTARMPRRAWRSGRGALILISGLLVSSAVIRLGSGAGQAIALELKATPAETASAEKSVADISPDLVALLSETQARSQDLDRRAAEIEARMQVLALVETQVEEKIARLEAAEAELRATMSAADTAAETDIARLTAVYENMKPEQASELFQRMEPSFAAGFLGRMRADAAAAVMAGLDPDLAYQISVVLAGRNADVPREPAPADG